MKEFKITNRKEFDDFWIKKLVPWRDKIKICGLLKNYVITFEIIDPKKEKPTKTNYQLRCFHLLCKMMVPHFKEKYGSNWDAEKIKDKIKIHTNFFKVNSCKNANFEDMEKLIKACEEIGKEEGLEGIKIESEYFKSFSNNKGKNV